VGALSPLLFNIVVDMLTILIKRAKAEGEIDRVVPHLVDDGLSELQYVDTIIFLDHDLEKGKNLKLLLCAFEKPWGLKIIFHKSELYCFGQAKEMQDQYSGIFGCQRRLVPFQIFRHSYAL
jgi:hypothetical protein